MVSQLVKSIVAPQRLASILDWKRKGSTLLCMVISDQSIDLAVADNPGRDAGVHRLDSLPYMGNSPRKSRGELKENVYEKLNQVVRENDVDGIVVAWPTLAGGRPGGSCGKVLHLLDYIAGEILKFKI